ncbi:MAG TPA: cyclase family protein [Acidimicrobiia bacterium]|nr:cyclase family protein [Acidimicrobiia bacterium]
MFIDISLPIGPDIAVWPGDPPVVVEAVARVEDGAAADVSRLELGTHTGTHVDPPAHFFPGGTTVDQIPLDVLVGPAVVADLTGGAPVDGASLEALCLPAGTARMLLKTQTAAVASPAAPAETPTTGVLTPDGAEWLVARGVRLVGADTLSIEPATDTYPVHRVLLAAGVVIVEGLDLTAAPPGLYELVCLPLRIADGDGAPARAVLRPAGNNYA